MLPGPQEKIKNPPQPTRKNIEDEVEAMLQENTNKYVENWVRPPTHTAIRSQIVYDEDQLEVLRWMQAKAKLEVANYMLYK